jgi:hypothetical protein
MVQDTGCTEYSNCKWYRTQAALNTATANGTGHRLERKCPSNIFVPKDRFFATDLKRSK